jgi:uncharacterized protein
VQGNKALPPVDINFTVQTIMKLSIVQQIAKEYKAGSQKLYGDELAEFIAFGSHARGNFHNASDIDFVPVFRRDAIYPAEETLITAPLSLPLEIKYGVMFSTLPVSVEKKQTSFQSVYRHIRTEGIAIGATPCLQNP